ncbi:MAG: DUF1517 domain-containing protein [Deltaproteobacteria bacterium]|jgi:uncharacterized membrane protein|nr:DUF1517 domain-containing protein [Deltaproteobacteria bacterium]MBK8697471.1 DUF1517 domain-containing protein [Deltaproteobacteria bacterium]MBP6830867.1 DUF1517 domain-containing protein [Deltaproteobacteria bacterium]
MQQFTVRRLSVGFGPSARPALQRDLDAMAPSVDLGTDEGRLEALHRIAGRLLADSAAASHSLLVDARRSLDEAPPFFDAMAEELRSRYPIETRRNELSAPAVVEGDLTVPGHLVVSVVLGAVGELAPCRADDRAGLLATLSSLRALDATVVALEVIWSPSVDTDRMSLDAMTTRYPELTALDA